MLKYINSIYEYEMQLQERLQNEYDRICRRLIYAKKNGIKEYWNELLWKKEEVETISEVLNISLLKERSKI